VFSDFWQSQNLSSEQIPFDGRSDYVGFTDLGIPAGGIFAGAEVPKAPAQEAIYGGPAGEQSPPATTPPATDCRASSGRLRATSSTAPPMR
jgi:Zn-dependent M28 family amino/carboxypeptidase